MKLPSFLWHPASPKRIEIIDALRGLSILLMVIHHALYDAVYFLGAPSWLFSNPVFDPLHYFFAGLFIFLSGVSCRFSHSNLKRGLVTFAAGWVVTLVTYLVDNPAWFGILHLLGLSALLVGSAELAFPKLLHGERSQKRDVARALVILASTILFVFMWSKVYDVSYNFKGFAWLGFIYPGYYSSDWFPLLPWFFVFTAGVAVGGFVVERRLPQKFYTAKVPFFAAVGRNTLAVYVLHQPVLYGVTMLIKLFLQ